MKRSKIFIIIFVVTLFLPLIDSVFNFSPVKDLFEKRLPVAAPEMPKNFSEVREFPRKFDGFFNDNYGFRKSLISLNGWVMDNIFNESPDARAVIGKEGWLYFDNHNSLLDAAGRAKISDQLIDAGVQSFAKNWKKMNSRNIKYLLVIAPDKSSAYPEFLPDYIIPKSPHRIDKFLTALKEKHPDFPVLDLRPVILEAKKNEILYHQTDTHWNRRGAHYAYVEMMKMLKIKPHLRDEFVNKESEVVVGDISLIMNSDSGNINYDIVAKSNDWIGHRNLEYEKLLKDFHKPQVFDNSNSSSSKKLFVYKDSFFGDLSGFVSGHFERSIYINEFPCDLNWEILKKYDPDVVIQQFWEGRIEIIFNQCSK
jgi:alginate O-acetyltransferase complex protein AlgJ